MSIQTDQYRAQPGDTLVNDDGTVTIDVEAVDGDAVDISDSRTYTEDGEYDRSDLESAVHDGTFTAVRDSDLTEIKGIGDSTAPKVEAITGCETPSELVEEYFTGQDGSVRDAMRRVDYLNQWIIENHDKLDISLSLAQIKVMLFLVEFDCSPRHSSVTNDAEGINNKYNTVDGEKLTIDHVEWSDDGVWVDRANVACLARGRSGLETLQPAETWDALQPCDSHERDGDHHRFYYDGDSGETWASGDYIDGLQDIFTFDLSDVQCHPEGEYPVMVEDRDTDLLVAIAPRVQPP